MAEENNKQEFVNDFLKKLEGFISTKTVVGTPIEVSGTTIIPLVDLTMGIGTGAFTNKATFPGSGMGAKISPTSILLIQNGNARLISIRNQDTVSKILDIVPGVLDKVKEMKVKTTPEVDEEIEKVKKQAKEAKKKEAKPEDFAE